MTQMRTDVLVIGGGGAAARAALEARLAGAEVVLATKGNFGAIGTRGSGATSGGSSSGSVFATPGWTGPLSEMEKRMKYMAAPDPDQAYSHIIQAGLGMADPKLVRILIEDAVESRTRLLDWGATFDEPGMKSHGVPIIAALANEIRKKGVVLMNHMMIVSLLLQGGECLGAIGVDERNGDEIVVAAGATVIGTGGDAGLFRHNLNPSGNTGDGFILGYEAGAELMNLEFKQIFPGTIFPTRNMLTQAFPPHTRLLNGGKEEFLEHYLPEGLSVEKCLEQRNGHNPFSTRDSYSRYVDFAILGEVKAGRGTDHQGVYLDRTDPQIPRISESANDFWLYRGIDFTRPAEIGVCHHCSLGGLRINEKAETRVPHLYAAGEVAAGPHGADRMGGHMLLASQVFGARAGRSGAAYARGRKLPEINSQVLKIAEERIEVLRKSKGQRSVSEATALLRQSAYFNLLVTRSEESLNKLREDVRQIRRDLLPDFAIKTPWDMVVALELQNLLTLAEIEARVCLTRTESRGPHYREEFPLQDDNNWLKSIVIRKDDENMVINTISLDPFWQDRGDKGIGYWG